MWSVAFCGNILGLSWHLVTVVSGGAPSRPVGMSFETRRTRRVSLLVAATLLVLFVFLPLFCGYTPVLYNSSLFFVAFLHAILSDEDLS